MRNLHPGEPEQTDTGTLPKNLPPPLDKYVRLIYGEDKAMYDCSSIPAGHGESAPCASRCRNARNRFTTRGLLAMDRLCAQVKLRNDLTEALTYLKSMALQR